MIELLQSGGFELKKFVAENAELLKDIESDCILHRGESKNLCDEQITSCKVLGIKWNSDNSTIAPKVDIKQRPETKRGLWATVAQIFDPLGICAPVSGQLPEWTQSRKTQSRRTQSRMDTIPNGHYPEWTQSRMDTIPKGHHPEWTPSRMDIIPNGHNPEWTPSRMDTIPNGHHPEWIQSRMDTIPNGHHPEWTPSRMDTIPNGHHPEWTPSRMDTIPNGHHPE